MTTSENTPAVTRRAALAGAATAAAGIALGGPPIARAARHRWPSAALSAAQARRIDPDQFLPASQLRSWQSQLDGLGLRATASRAEGRYIDQSAARLERAGVAGVHLESLSIQRWTPRRWSLEVGSGTAARPLPTAAYIPYSGSLPPGGVAAPLALVDPRTPPAPGSLTGKIAVFEAAALPARIGLFLQLAIGTYDPGRVLSPSSPYVRPWLNGVVASLEQIQAAGAVGVVGILDLPGAAAAGSYFPYDGALRHVPGVYVDRTVGAQLRTLAREGATARLQLEADVARARTHNVVGLIPGASRELVVLHSHTDGTNGLEDNGPNAIVAIGQYLARLPRHALGRSVLILLTSGHFYGGVGVRSFLRRHHDDHVRRIAAAITLEHLGADEWGPRADGSLGATGNPEPAGFFLPRSRALADEALAAARRAKGTPTFVARPMNEKPDGPNHAAWPGEGQYLWAEGRIPTANYITGPTYLLNHGITTTDRVDARRMRREAMAFAAMAVRLGRVPRRRLRAEDVPIA